MPRKYQRKTERKSKLLKLNRSAVRTGDPYDATVELDWQKIEAAYRPLPLDARGKISAVLKYYIGEDQSEHHAPYLKDAISKISRLTDCATALLGEHRDRKEPAAAVALSHVETRFGDWLDDILESYLDACKQAWKQVNEDSRNSGFQEGRAWRSMVWRLLDVVKEFNLPSAVAKPSERSQRPSPFVALVGELQKQLPPVHWPPPETRESLAQAIAKVRSQRAKREC